MAEMGEIIGDFVGSLYNLQFTIFDGVKGFSDGGLTIELGNVAATAKNIFSYNSFTSLYSLTNNITQGTVIALATSILTLMVIIDFIDKSLKFNKETSWEMILFTCVKFAVYLFLINNIQKLLKDVIWTAMYLIDPSKTNAFSSGSVKGLKAVVKKIIWNADFVDFELAWMNIGSTCSQLIMGAVFLALCVPMIGSQIALWTPIFTKLISFAILVFIAPIPTALLYGGQGPQARAFIMKSISVALEIVLSYVVLVIYCKGMTTFKVADDTTAAQAIGIVAGLFFYNGLFSSLLGEVSHLSHDILR